MPWVKLDDQFPDHLKLAVLGRHTPLCGWLYICGLAFCNRQLTDGHIPKPKIHSLASFYGLQVETGGVGKGSDRLATFSKDVDIEELAGLLVASGLWEEDEFDYIVHDYLDYQPSRDDVLAERAATKHRVQSFRGRGRNAVGNGVGNAVTSGGGNSVGNSVCTPSPDPDPDPDPKESTPLPRTRGENEDDERFIAFWDAYPRRVNRKDAKRAWLRLKPSDALVEIIMAALERHKRQPTWVKDRGQFVPHAATWLNGRRWDDELEDVAPFRVSNGAPSGSACPHQPMCSSTRACIDRTLADGRAERASA